MGPVISARQKALVEGMLSLGRDLPVAARGQVVADAPEGGFYVPPALFADVPATTRWRSARSSGRRRW